MPNCAPTKKQVMKAIISIFINARPVASLFALYARKSAIMDMIWFIGVMMTSTVYVESTEKEMNHARYGNKGCRFFKQEVQN